ncbi:hypothetical protein GCM10020000_31330 [Streptomyces olivoverticillatus]
MPLALIASWFTPPAGFVSAMSDCSGGGAGDGPGTRSKAAVGTEGLVKGKGRRGQGRGKSPARAGCAGEPAVWGELRLLRSR